MILLQVVDLFIYDFVKFRNGIRPRISHLAFSILIFVSVISDADDDMPLSEMVAKRKESSSENCVDKNIVEKQIAFANSFIEKNMGDSVNRSARFVFFSVKISKNEKLKCFVLDALEGLTNKGCKVFRWIFSQFVFRKLSGCLIVFR